MNFAQIQNSPRLQRTHAVLMDGLEHTTLNIITKARVCAVNSIVSELRDNGFDIKCQRRGDLWFYRMLDGNETSAEETNDATAARMVRAIAAGDDISSNYELLGRACSPWW